MPLRKSCLSRKGSSLLESFLQKPSDLQREEEEEGEGDGDCTVSDRWSKMLPELLSDIIKRVESSKERWPLRKDVVACASVCKRWREVTRSIVESPQRSGKITFPSSLKQPGPGDNPLQCFIKRDKKNSTFYLYLGLTPASVENGKFLLAAHRFRHGGHTEYIISLGADNLSRGNNAFVGKLSSDFLGKKFTIYDTQPPYYGAKPSGSRAGCRFTNKKIFPQGPSGSFEIGQVSYDLNLLRARGPRRMLCSLHCPSTAETTDEHQNCKTQNPPVVPARWVVMKNKAPRWHDRLQCWCLNFHGRVTIASVKNFQLVAATDSIRPEARGDDDVLLQFGKVGNNMFTMDYRQPLSAFQAFAICLTSFGTKLAYQ